MCVRNPRGPPLLAPSVGLARWEFGERAARVGMRLRAGCCCPRTGAEDLRGQGAADEALGFARSVDECVEVNAGVDAHVLDHVHELLRRDVATRAGRVRAAAEPADGS